MMMFDIVIIGYGRAGRLHHKFYKEYLHGDSFVFYFDPFIKNESISIKGKIERLDLDQIKWERNIILDICTNSDRHIEWIEFAIERNIKYVIIEKPLVTTQEDMSRVQKLPTDKTKYFTVNYNYLCSPILIEIKNTIDKFHLKVKELTTNFSKNRTNDSFSKRGADKEGFLLHNFFIEIPHQLSIATKLLGEIQEIVCCSSSDMIIKDEIFKHHGNGSIEVLHKGGTLSRHYSNLTNEYIVREMTIKAENNYVLKAFFGFPPHHLGSIELIRNGTIEFSKMMLDKSLDAFLLDTFLFFNNNRSNTCDLDFAFSLNQIILKCVDKSLLP